jgi:uncharacterized protein (TIGR02246 family)
MFSSKVAVVALAMLPTSFAQPKAGSIESRLQHLEDVDEIRTVLTDYGRFLDARDFKSYSLLFAKDGEWIGGLGKVQGPAAIQAFMEKAFQGPNTAHNYHILSSFEIEVHGDTATAWSRWSFVVPGPDKKPALSQAGRYDDTFVRENGHWKFKRRTASNDLPGPAQPK